MFPENEYLFPPVSDSCRLLVGCRRQDYSASRIAHAVEDCDAHLLNLNVTALHYDGDGSDADVSNDVSKSGKFPVVCDLRVDHRNCERISRSLERYGYTVLRASTDDKTDDSTLRRRIDEFLHYLEI